MYPKIVMRIYLVSYDLATPDGDYEGLELALSECASDDVLPVLGSVRLLASELTAKEIREHVRTALGEEDKLFIVEITDSAWCGIRTKAKAWIEEHRGKEDS